MSDAGPISAQRWRENWRALVPPGAVRADVPRPRAGRRTALAALRELPPGTPVALVASAPGAAGRCRAFASAAGVELEREYLAFPSAAAPAYLVEDAPAALRLFVQNILVAPPRVPFSRAVEGALSLLRRSRSWRTVRTLAPGRVAVGRRT